MKSVSRCEELGSGARSNRTQRAAGYPYIRRSSAGLALLLAAHLAACVPVNNGSNLPPGASTGPGTSTLEISPTTPLLSTGEAGKTFAPGSQDYEILNASAFPSIWAAEVDQPWVQLSSTGGTMMGGVRNTLTVSIDQQVAAGLFFGIHTAIVTITDMETTDIFIRDVTLTVTAGGLLATPLQGFTSSGEQGGPFVPAGQEFILLNSGSDPIDWTASSNQTWLEVSLASGQLAGGALETIRISIEPTVASGLSPGSYAARVTINDLSNAQSLVRDFTLQVDVGSVASNLDVTPPDDLVSVGTEGGPFAPASQDYTLTNAGGGTLNWSASKDQNWIMLSSTSGSLGAGQQATLTVSIDQSILSALSLGTYVGAVTITDQTSGKIFVRNVSVQVNPVGGGGNLASSVTQFGITWNFDRAYEVGQFANGDWWVVGPVNIIRITPASTEVGGRISNGSMVNPSPRNNTVQGYDSTMYAQYKVQGDFNNSFNKAWGVSVGNPLRLQPHSSLVSTISESTPNVRPQINTAAILTVLPGAASPGDFRPPYCGTDKTIQFNESQLQYGLLAKLDPVPGITKQNSIADAERMFERPWLDHVPLWIGRYIHPSQNMPDYGREIVDNVSVAALLLHMNYTDGQKRTLLVRFVQLGIDFFGIGMNGGQGNWRSAAGHMSGRKWPILFAGLMLGDVEMSNVGYDKLIKFGEDDQTFNVAETPPGSGIYNQGYGNYTAQHLGMPEWGTNHPNQPWFDDEDWFGDPYRLCCTSNAWWGQLLAAHIMGRETWDHQVLFDYQDRFRQVNIQRGILDWRLAWRDWYYEMWEGYRGNY